MSKVYQDLEYNKFINYLKKLPFTTDEEFKIIFDNKIQGKLNDELLFYYEELPGSYFIEELNFYDYKFTREQIIKIIAYVVENNLPVIHNKFDFDIDLLIRKIKIERIMKRINKT
jgi:hypothetical protein